MLVAGGSTNVTTYFAMRLAADGTAATALTITNFDLQYVRSGAAPSAKVDATALAATDSAHGDNQAFEIDATDQPGLYRVDWPDAAFAAGVREVILTVKVATCFTEHLRCEIDGEVNVVEWAGTDVVAGAIPAAAADAAGGLVISDAGGLDIDQTDANVTLVLTDTGTTLDDHLTDLKGTGFVKDTHSMVDIEAYVDILDDGTSGNAKIATDVAATLADTQVIGTPSGISLSADVSEIKIDTQDMQPKLGTVQDLGTGATLSLNMLDMAGVTFSTSTDSQEAIRNRGDSAWTTGAGGSDRLLMVDTTIATLSSQTSFTLTAGSPDDNAYVNCTIVIEDASTSTQKAVGLVSAYTGSTKTVTLKYDPGIFTMATTDKVYILAENALKSTDQNRQLDVTATGAAGIDWANVENPTTALDLSATDIQLCDTVTTLTGHTAQTADHTAGIADVPTVAEFNARTIAAASYFDPAADTVANVTTVATLTGHTAQTADHTAAIADVPTVAEFNARTLAAAAYFDPAADTVATVTAVSGAVGSVTGAVGSVTGAVGSVAGNVDGNVTGSVGTLAAAAKAEVLAEVNTALDTAIAELGVAAPTATPTVRTGLMLLYMALRNKLVVQTSGTDALEVYNDAGTKIASKLLTDDGSDYTEAEMT